MEEDTIVVGEAVTFGTRYLDGALKNSKQYACTYCGEMTWISEDSRPQLDAGARVACFDCACEKHPTAELLVTEEVRRGLEVEFGRPVSVNELLEIVERARAERKAR